MAVLRWDARRSRYIIIRQYSNLSGYMPIETRPNLESERGTGVGIQVLLDKDGQMLGRNYIYTANRVYQLEEKPVAGAPRHVPPGGFGSRYVFSPLESPGRQ